jgi:hypothetical protein
MSINEESNGLSIMKPLSDNAIKLNGCLKRRKMKSSGKDQVIKKLLAISTRPLSFALVSSLKLSGFFIDCRKSVLIFNDV